MATSRVAVTSTVWIATAAGGFRPAALDHAASSAQEFA